MQRIGFAIAAVFLVVGSLVGHAKTKPALPPPPATPLRYPDVQPVFEKHCASCHDVRKSKNPGAQAVFEMSNGYPFSTKRPGTLLDDLRHMFENRGSLSTDEKWRGVSWISAGALDAAGQPPIWR
jgi:hypothetical protein